MNRSTQEEHSGLSEQDASYASMVCESVILSVVGDSAGAAQPMISLLAMLKNVHKVDTAYEA